MDLSKLRGCLILITSLILLVSCQNETVEQTTADKVTTEPETTTMLSDHPMGTHIVKGFSLSPSAFDEEDFLDFLDKLDESGSVLRWGGDIMELRNPDNAAVVTANISAENRWQALIATEFYKSKEERLSLSDEAMEERIDLLVLYAETHQPAYMSLGVEINHKLQDDPEELELYGDYFDIAYDRIKKVSPETQVMITLQYEWLLGLKDNLFGAEATEPAWDQLAYFKKADIIGFTTYPCLNYEDPGMMPSDYYTQIQDYTDKLIAFTEIGWFSELDIPGWESSEAEQARFVTRYFELTAPVQPVISVWSFMYEIIDEIPFKTMSFFDGEGNEKEAWQVWLDPVEAMNAVKDKPIYFVSRLDTPEGEIYRYIPDGNIERITFNDRHENNIALSNDGSMIAFHGGEEEDFLSYEIFTLDLQTMEEKQWTDNRLLDGHPDWSPDGSQLIYASFDDGKGNPNATADIYLLELATGDKLKLTDSPYEDNDPEISPDGTMVVFKSTRHTKEPAKEEIYVMDLDGGNVRRLTTVEGWMSDHDPSWSPRGNDIVFERFEGDRQWTDIGNLDILVDNVDQLTPWNNYMVRLDGNLTQLTYLDQGQIGFLPIYYGEDILYLEMQFLYQDGDVIGTDKKILKQSLEDLTVTQFMYDTEHRYTIEYIDW